MGDNRYPYDPMHFWIVMGYNTQQTLLWGFYPNKLMVISHCYVSVFKLQSHILSCSFVGTPVFWNPMPAARKISRRACARIPDVTIHVVLSCRTFRLTTLFLWSAELYFVELAYHACVSRWAQPGCKSCKHNSAAIQTQLRTFDVIKSIAIECVRA